MRQGAEDICIFPGIMPIVGCTNRKRQEKYEELVLHGRRFASARRRGGWRAAPTSPAIPTDRCPSSAQ
jgi:hypothetical protein